MKSRNQENTDCPDCGVKIGEEHIEYCDIPMCLNCSLQAFTCDCPEPKTIEKWLGFEKAMLFNSTKNNE
jgi:hypothetical protein